MASPKRRPVASEVKAQKILAHAVSKGHPNVHQSVMAHGLTLDHPTAMLAAQNFNSIMDRVHDYRVEPQDAALSKLIRQAPGTRKGAD